MKNDGRLRMMAIGTALVMLSPLMAGCGKKGDPIPQRTKPAAEMVHKMGVPIASTLERN